VPLKFKANSDDAEKVVEETESTSDPPGRYYNDMLHIQGIDGLLNPDCYPI